MTDAERKALTDERAELQRKLKARERLEGYGDNVRAINARLAAIDLQLNPAPANG